MSRGSSNNPLARLQWKNIFKKRAVETGSKESLLLLIEQARRNAELLKEQMKLDEEIRHELYERLVKMSKEKKV